MNRFIKTWEKKLPILFSIVVYILHILFTQVLVSLLENRRIYGIYRKQALLEMCAAIVAIVLLIITYKGKTVLKSRKGFFKSIFVGAAFLVLPVYSLISQIIYYQNKRLANPKDLIAFTACMILIGITEEVLFRGIIFDTILDKYGKDKKGVIFSLAVSSVMFGAVHLFNIFAGITPLAATVQAIAAAFLGLVFCAVYLRTHNIFAVIFFHAFVDFVSLAESGLWGIGSHISSINEYSNIGVNTFIPIIVYLVISVFLLRFSKLDEYIESRDKT